MEEKKIISWKEFISEMRQGAVDTGACLDFLQPGEGDRPFARPIILENGATVWGYCTIAPTAQIGKDVTIGAFTNICGNVVIGDYTRMQGFNFIPQGVTIEDRVFIGPGVIFTNVIYPTVRFGDYSWERVYEKTLVRQGASIGAGAVICPGVTIGKRSLIAAGSVVTKDVTEGWLVKGNPARHIRQFADVEREEAHPALTPGKDAGWS